MRRCAFPVVTQASSPPQDGFAVANLSCPAGILPAEDVQDARRTNSQDGCVTQKEAK
jgi:hypothetical protein